MPDPATPGSPAESRLFDAVRPEILAGLLVALERAQNPIVNNQRARASLIAQVAAILDDVVDAMGPAPRGGEPSVLDWQQAADVGLSRAAQGVHPSASLEAAALLFEVAFPILLREIGSTDGGGDLTDAPAASMVGVALNQAIMRRVALAAVPYVSFLIKNLRTSHLNERQRVARELHDRAAHGVGLGLRNLELSRLYADEPVRAAQRFAAAEEALRDALDVIRSLSAQLRQTVGDASLADAIRGYLGATVPTPVVHNLTAVGDVNALPAEIGEELYLIAREAIRNALLHAEMSELRVHVVVDTACVTITVTDNGRGFDSHRAFADPAGGGLLSMSERTGLLGGVVEVMSADGAGTVVTITVPRAPGWP
jgi:signal transduction histidine kinase